MIEFFKKLFQRQKWALVKSFAEKHGYSLYHIHCFESSKGKRKIECIRSGSNYNIKNDEYNFKSTNLYQIKIYRWLQGRRDMDIPRYDEINEDDTANYLRGKL